MVIKGSEAAVQTDIRRISASEYFFLSNRNFTAFRHDWALLYALYEQYEEMKRRQGEHDMMDRVHRVYKLLQERGHTGQPIREVYSDEVQDLTVAQVKLLLSMCHLPEGEGERFTGGGKMYKHNYRSISFLSFFLSIDEIWNGCSQLQSGSEL